MIKELIKLADHLDQKGFTKEAEYIDYIIKKALEDSEEEDSEEKDSEDLEHNWSDS